MVRVIRTVFRQFSSSGFAAHPCIWKRVFWCRDITWLCLLSTSLSNYYVAPLERVPLNLFSVVWTRNSLLVSINKKTVHFFTKKAFLLRYRPVKNCQKVNFTPLRYLFVTAQIAMIWFVTITILFVDVVQHVNLQRHSIRLESTFAEKKSKERIKSDS